MSKKITVLEEENPIYDILIQTKREAFYQECKNLDMEKRRVCIVSDTNVSSYYLNEFVQELKEHVKISKTFVFQAGEESKQLQTVQQLYRFLMEEKFDRKDFLIALGGGVVGDLTGFAAATYLRGIRFIQMPTSLLAMVDSSIGGKTGVDLEAYKNMIGAFHQPVLVYIDLKTLDTLPNREFYSGFAEIIKHGLIKDKEYYEWLYNNQEKIQQKDKLLLEEMIAKSCEIKRGVVERDPKEKKERAILNFGHTIGHAVEKIMNFQMLHGECISLGLAASCYISFQRGNITKEEFEKVLEILQIYHLPISIKGLEAEHILEVMQNDKKMAAGKIKFILLKKIGEAMIDETVTEEEMKKAILYLQEDKRKVSFYE